MYSAVLFKRFQSATAFNGDVTAWDTSRVTELFTTFHKASAFNGDLTNWNIDKVTTMTNIFTGATSFKRTLCGSKWSSLNAFSAGNGRSGCCAIDRYMLNPFLTPFVESQACSACPNGQYRPKLNSDLHCGIYQKEPLPNGIPDSATVGLRKVVKDYLDTPDSDAYNAVIAKYGLMEEWDVSQVTNMKNVFVGRSGFNLDISKWVCDWFCCGFDFYFGCTSTLTFSPLTHSFFQNSNRTQNRMCPTWLTWNRFLTVQLPSTKISMHGIRLQLRP